MQIEGKKHWSAFWRQGHLSSLPSGFAANYEGEFLDFWNEQFAALDRGDCVLDACCGNGSIALLASEYSLRNELGLRITACDAADIDVASILARHPQLRRSMEGIEFMPNTLLEDLGAASNSVDLVASQYGIEYTNWGASARNITRLLKDGGRFCLVCHCPDSTILRQMEAQHADYVRLLQLDLLASDRAPGDVRIDPQSFLRELDHALDQIHDMFRKNPSSGLLSSVGSSLENVLAAARKQPDAGWRAFLVVRRQIGISHATSGDLLAVHHALRTAPRWYEVFIDAGLELIGSGEIRYHTGEIAGMSHRFRKPA